MRKWIFCMILAAAASNAVAQIPLPTNQSQPSERILSVPKTDLLSPFSKLEIDGPMSVTLKAAASDADVKIVYDTKGCTTSRFKASVNKDGALRIEERIDQKRDTNTEVTLYYRSLTDIRIMRATVVFDDEMECRMLDMTVASGAIVKLGVKTLDMTVECTGRSSMTLSGTSRYFRLNASSSVVDARHLNTVSSVIDASHNAEVRIVVSERLEATTSTAAKLLYRGRPAIVREHTSLFGGDIISID